MLCIDKSSTATAKFIISIMFVNKIFSLRTYTKFLFHKRLVLLFWINLMWAKLLSSLLIVFIYSVIWSLLFSTFAAEFG